MLYSDFSLDDIGDRSTNISRLSINTQSNQNMSMFESNTSSRENINFPPIFKNLTKNI
jgi:hypothetical protein